MNNAILKKIIETSRWAPSGDNCQPWHFTWASDALTVTHLRDLGQHELNKNYNSSAIALGGLYTYLEVAAERYGYQTHLIEKLFAPLGELKLKIRFEKMAAPTTENAPLPKQLFSALATRHTDRRPYSGKKIDPAILTSINSLNKDFYQAKITVAASPTEGPLLNYLCKSEKFLWSALPKGVHDLLTWVHFSSAAAKASGRGMHFKGLAAPLPAALIFWFMKKFKLAANLFRPLLAVIAPQITKLNIKSSAALIAFTAKKPNLEAHFDCGRLSVHAWLLLESHKISAQPVSLGCLPLQDIPLDKTYFADSPEALAHYSQGAAIIQNQMILTKDDNPLWMLRCGYAATPYPDEMRTLRCETEKLITIT